MRSVICVLFIFAALAFGCAYAEASFDWGSGGDGGSGSFTTQTEQRAAIVVGEIPSGLSGVEIYLVSTNDVDIQLYDQETNTPIVAWPGGFLNGPNTQTTDYGGVTIEYSGYNGDQTPTGRGNEYIKILDTTNRPLIMKAYGYTAGSAVVNYTWTGGGETIRIAELEAQLAQLTAERDARPTQVAYDAAVATARTDGQGDVTSDPASYSLFTEDQIHAMSADYTMGLNEAGNVEIKIFFIESADLQAFTPFTVNPDSLSVVDGKICMEFTPSDDAAFFFRFRIE